MNCTKINQLLENVCDLSKYSTVKFADGSFAPYKSFARLRGALIGHILRKSPSSACFRGTIYYWIPEFNGKYGWPTYWDKTINDCPSIITDDFEYYAFTMIFYKVETEDDLDIFGMDPETLEKRFENSKTGSHANGILVNNQRKEVQLIEPNGSDVPWRNSSETALIGYMTKQSPRLFENYKRIVLEDSCPNIGPQFLADDEFCAAWVQLIIYLCLHCPSLSALQIQQQLTQKGSSYVRQVMQGWMCFSWAYADISGIVELLNMIESHQPPYSTTVWDTFQSGDLEATKRLMVLEDQLTRTDTAHPDGYDVDAHKVYNIMQRMILGWYGLTNRQKERYNEIYRRFMAHN